MFLNQRKKGWIAQSESSLRNAAIQMESCSTGNQGSYVPCTIDYITTTEGFRGSSGVVVLLDPATPAADEFCLVATHTQTSIGLYYYDSNVGAPNQTDCG